MTRLMEFLHYLDLRVRMIHVRLISHESDLESETLNRMLRHNEYNVGIIEIECLEQIWFVY